MKNVLKKTVMLTAALLMSSAAWAAVIAAGSGQSDVGIFGCNDKGPVDQQKMGVRVDCVKQDGSFGKQCVSEGTGPKCAMKVLPCQ